MPSRKLLITLKSPGNYELSLKPKGLDGTPYPPRGACPIIDNPRLTSPFLVYQPVYLRRQLTT